MQVKGWYVSDLDISVTNKSTVWNSLLCSVAQSYLPTSPSMCTPVSATSTTSHPEYFSITLLWSAKYIVPFLFLLQPVNTSRGYEGHVHSLPFSSPKSASSPFSHSGNTITYGRNYCHDSESDSRPRQLHSATMKTSFAHSPCMWTCILVRETLQRRRLCWSP